MLGQHLIGHESVISLQLAMHDYALALLEQIRQDAFIENPYRLKGIAYIEVHRQSIPLALDTAFHYQAANTEVSPLRRFLVIDLSGGEIKTDVILQGIQNQAYC